MAAPKSRSRTNPPTHSARPPASLYCRGNPPRLRFEVHLNRIGSNLRDPSGTNVGRRVMTPRTLRQEAMTAPVMSSTLFVGRRASSPSGLALAPCTPRPWPRRRRPTSVFELRTYTAPEGKLPDLNARFRNHTMRIFQKHGMSNVGYWVPQDAPLKDNTLDLHHQPRQPRRRQEELGRFRRRSRMEESVRRIPGQRPHRDERRLGVHGRDRLLADQIGGLVRILVAASITLAGAAARSRSPRRTQPAARRTIRASPASPPCSTPRT